MRERLKSVILLTLVLTSLYMTGQLWRDIYSPPQQPTSGIDVTSPEPLALLVPVAATLHTDSAARQFAPGDPGYSVAWDGFRSIIQGAHLVSVRLTNEAEWKKAMNSSSVELRLAGKVQLRMWLEALGIQPNYLSSEYSFDRVLFSTNSSNVYFWDSATSTFVIWDNIAPKDDPNRVKDRAAMVVSSLNTLGSGYSLRLLDPPYRAMAAPWVYIPRNPGDWPQLWARSEKSKSQQLVSSFFNDWSLVRRIGMRDGRIHYTDGNRGVDLDLDGAIEFYEEQWFKPGADIHRTASMIFSSGLSFVARHGGWPDEARLTLMEAQLSKQGIPYWHFEFAPFTTVVVGNIRHYVPIVTYRQQIAVGVTERAASPALEYLRYLYYPLGTGASPITLMSAERALMVAEKSLIPDKMITNMYVGYYQREIDQAEELLFPVWVIEQGQHKILVHGYVQKLIE